jgi:hypothetical protein
LKVDDFITYKILITTYYTLNRYWSVVLYASNWVAFVLRHTIFIFPLGSWCQSQGSAHRWYLGWSPPQEPFRRIPSSQRSAIEGLQGSFDRVPH